MISIRNATLTYSGASSPVLREISLEIGEGELVLVIGHTGSGKSSLLHLINGLAPHHTGGTLHGDAIVGGHSIREHKPRDLAHLVGMVAQDPLESFVTDTVEEEIVFGMESAGLSTEVMRKRTEEVLDLLGLAALRHRILATLSGGEQQRVAIAAAMVMHPSVLVLDEPTSALDPNAADEVLGILHRLVHDLGITVIVAEHRLERVIQYADRIVHVIGDGSIIAGSAVDLMRTSSLTPPVIELGRLAGWDPLPLTIRDARRLAEPLRTRLAQTSPPSIHTSPRSSEPLASLTKATVRFGDQAALSEVSLEINSGEIIAVMGRNGAGKTTMLHTLVGMRRPSSGSVTVGGHIPHTLAGTALIHLVGLVPQEPGDLLYNDSVEHECAQSDRDAGAMTGTTRQILDDLTPEIDHSVHPRDLSEGQRLSLALSVVLASSPPLLLLDEPTRGLDYLAKARLTTALRRLANAGHAIVFATHDVELAAELASRVVVLADGEVVADGTTEVVLTASPAFAPQVAKILAPERWLTVRSIVEAMGP